MDPGRRAMISGRKSPPRRDITAPRRDANTRISKPQRSFQPNTTSTARQTYLSQDEQSQRFVADEDKFVLKQSKKKADIRVREGRAKPIDLLAFNLRYVDTDRDVFDDNEKDVQITVPAPTAVIEALSEAEATELDSEIASYHTLETNARNREYWTALRSLVTDHKLKLKPLAPEGRAVSAVTSDVDKILGPKSLQQLEKLEGQIQAKLRSDEVMDTDYWEQLLKSLQVYKAKARLRKICDLIRDNQLKLLAKIDPDKAAGLAAGNINAQPSLKDQFTVSAAINRPKPAVPSSSSTSSAPPGTARFAFSANEDFSQATKALYEREVARGVNEDEEIFTAEETVSGMTKPQWADKYRPRKPRYFNRVQMGYEWNKYNQTHYDHDNPPPKVVQGYKFNIFYPDLIDKTKAPTFKIIREHGRRKGESLAPAGEEDTCLIRFISGPPYEDIAFRIVDREWDYSAKKDRGFKSSFDKVSSHICCVTMHHIVSETGTPISYITSGSRKSHFIYYRK
ncbi:mid region of cactin-domain-containing protein [Xylaria bambusicola]|uniref:mid region of cactin-domain-containing protein n=1 Tax=Xylaria bambusicola TaxID=326684 RepID=UPI002008A9B4|nr:mid region of cactin-domain-containing protein [Xylaria bambusicola]KAI0521485.1 mid region of cactin-domain-containing protein [Xylaria bambusicola]